MQVWCKVSHAGALNKSSALVSVFAPSKKCASNFASTDAGKSADDSLVGFVLTVFGMIGGNKSCVHVAVSASPLGVWTCHVGVLASKWSVTSPPGCVRSMPNASQKQETQRLSQGSVMMCAAVRLVLYDTSTGSARKTLPNNASPAMSHVRTPNKTKGWLGRGAGVICQVLPCSVCARCDVYNPSNIGKKNPLGDIVVLHTDGCTFVISTVDAVSSVVQGAKETPCLLCLGKYSGICAAIASNNRILHPQLVDLHGCGGMLGDGLLQRVHAIGQ